ncbi:MAG: major facilitator superfamily transporter [Frankiales bacterium]|nr:major facilitator superfamily transporter [Frankiales bacterium]
MRSRERRGLVLAFLVFGGYWGAWSATLPAMRRQAGVSDGELGAALAAVAVASVPVMLVTGRLVDRFGPGRTLPASVLLFAVAVPLPGLTHSFWTLALALAAIGVGTGALDLAINAAAAGWERLEGEHLMSLVHAAFSGGVLVGAVLAGVARQQGAPPLHILLVVAAFTALVAVTQPPYRQLTAEPRERGRRLPMFLIGIGLLTAGAFLCEDALQSWSSLRLERGLGASPAISGLGPGLFAGSMAVGRLMGGWLSSRYAAARVFQVAAVVLAAGAVVVAVAGSPLVALLGLAVAGAGTSVLAPVLYSAVGARSTPGSQGADLATVAGVGYVGFVLGPPVVGAVSAGTSLPVALGGLGVVAAALALTGPLLLRP